MSLKNPELSILEIGAGSGATTECILNQLGEDSKASSYFSSYTFSDISPGFFENAQRKFDSWSARMSYKALNIEIDPISQGFEEASYDVIVAANVLHATAKLADTVSNVKKLLKPGGKLCLIEHTNPKIYTSVIFGCFPGWWL